MSQEIKNINIEDLVLWTENPRDPAELGSGTNQEIAERAISEDKRSKWSLKKLFDKMGSEYDFSELPTVSYIDKKPVVYDGNRRILIGMIIHEIVSVNADLTFPKFDFPKTIPCNVCDKRTALNHVDRKHADNGTWKALERDIFKHKHMDEDKSAFLILEEATRIISSNPALNQRFVKDEVLNETNLHAMGFSVTSGELKNEYENQKSADEILSKVVEVIEQKQVTTRTNRGKILDVLANDNNTKAILNQKTGKFKKHQRSHIIRKTPIAKPRAVSLFGENLPLKSGTVNNIYSDLCKLYKFSKKNQFSDDIKHILRMSLRLLVEFAWKDLSNNQNDDFDKYIKNYFVNAKNNLTQDQKNTLSSQSTSEHSKLIELLNTGAHAYTASKNIEQTVAMSLIIGQMLLLSHGKEK